MIFVKIDIIEVESGRLQKSITSFKSRTKEKVLPTECLPEENQGLPPGVASGHAVRSHGHERRSVRS